MVTIAGIIGEVSTVLITLSVEVTTEGEGLMIMETAFGVQLQTALPLLYIRTYYTDTDILI